MSNAPPDVTVTPGNPLTITDSARDFGVVTIQPGGQIFVQTKEPVTIGHLIRTPNSRQLTTAPTRGPGVSTDAALASASGHTTADITIVGAPGKTGATGTNGHPGVAGPAGPNAVCDWAS